MATKSFIFQGFTSKTHKDAVRDIFEIEDVQRVIISVAFVNMGGVELIDEKLKEHYEKTTAYIGIRNDITTLQSAKHLLDIGVGLYTVDTGTRHILFHPKIYLVRGASRAKLIIGSANLTTGGLNNNIEAGIVVDCDLSVASDKELVDGIEESFADLAQDHPLNVIRVTSEAQLDVQHQAGLLLDEMAASPPRPSSSGSSTLDDPTPRIKLKVNRIFSSISAARRAANRSVAVAEPQPSVAAPAEQVTAQEPVVGVDLALVWQSKELTRRDLDVPLEGRNTNRTGSINLDKGLLADDVDHRHYFREEVFSDLSWTNRSSTVDEAHAKFQLVIKGVSYGEFDLRIGHTTSTTSRTYEQHNAMTRLSWGPIREYVARPDLIGRRVSLYRDSANPKLFVLEID